MEKLFAENVKISSASKRTNVDMRAAENADEGQRQKKRGAAGRCSATATQAERTLRQEANTDDVGCKPAADRK